MVIGIKEFYNNVRNEARDFFLLIKICIDFVFFNS